ncbi:MAG: AlpA family phage regulatory protein [Paucibacter sp.]|nr:AlpA family phage regulatory protein [Roseateles sp.]
MQANHDTSKPGRPSPTLLRLPMVMHMTGLGRSTIYEVIAKEQFPGPIRLSDRAVAWRQVDLAAWIEGRVATH